jgi:hypothetical protein
MVIRRAAWGLTLLCVSVPAFAQKTDFSSLLANKDVPFMLKLKDLSGDWRRMKFTGTAMAGTGMEGFASMLSSLGPLMQAGMMSEMGKPGGAAGGAGMDAMMPAMMSMFGNMFGGGEPIYYTKGQTVEMGTETFIIAYRHKKPENNFMQALMGAAAKEGEPAGDKPKENGKEPDITKMMEDGKLSAESDLSVVLLNTKSIGMLHDLRPFDMQKEIEEAKSANGLADLMMAGMKGGGEAIAPEGAAEPVSVEADIQELLNDDSKLAVPGNKITVKVEDNVIVLSGSVKTAQMKQRATNLTNNEIKLLGGGYTVRNEIQVVK